VTIGKNKPLEIGDAVCFVDRHLSRRAKRGASGCRFAAK
jgi:hypothetical protein